MCSPGCLINLEKGNSAVTAGLARCPAERTAVVKDTDIAVVEYAQDEDACGICAQDLDIVLAVLPSGWRSRIQSEISLVSKFRENVSVPFAVLVVNFDNPGLVAARVEQISVVR